MIEIRKGELRLDEMALLWATNEEIIALKEITKTIFERASEMVMFPESGHLPLDCRKGGGVA